MREGHWDTDLTDAAREGDLEKVKLLADGGAEIDEPNYYGDTPLMIAAIYDHVDVVNELLARGASIFLCNRDGDNAIKNAITNSNWEAVQAILNSPHNTKEYLDGALKDAKFFYDYSIVESNNMGTGQSAKIYKKLVDLCKAEIDGFDMALLCLRARDTEAAKEHFARAAQNGNKDAENYLDIIEIAEKSPLTGDPPKGKITEQYYIKAVYGADGGEIQNYLDCKKENITKVEAEKWTVTSQTKQINHGEGEIITVDADYFTPNSFGVIGKDDWYAGREDGTRDFNILQTWYYFWHGRSGGVIVAGGVSYGLENKGNVQFFGDQAVRHELYRLMYQIELAFNGGNARAQYLVGKRCLEGDGMRKDLGMATFMLINSAARGDTDAFEALKKIEDWNGGEASGEADDDGKADSGEADDSQTDDGK